MDVPLMSKVLVFVLFIAGKIPLREEVRHPIIPHEKKKICGFFFLSLFFIKSYSSWQFHQNVTGASLKVHNCILQFDIVMSQLHF